jgi:hypothetical protein
MVEQGRFAGRKGDVGDAVPLAGPVGPPDQFGDNFSVLADQRRYNILTQNMHD